MTDSNSSQTESRTQAPEQSSTSNGSLFGGIDAISRSARRAEEAVMEHPYFTAGVLAGIGLTIGGLLVLRANRRKSLFDLMMRWF